MLCAPTLPPSVQLCVHPLLHSRSRRSHPILLLPRQVMTANWSLSIQPPRPLTKLHTVTATTGLITTVLTKAASPAARAISGYVRLVNPNRAVTLPLGDVWVTQPPPGGTGGGRRVARAECPDASASAAVTNSTPPELAAGGTVLCRYSISNWTDGGDGRLGAVVVDAADGSTLAGARCARCTRLSCTQRACNCRVHRI